jgi:AraC family transcriptional regulator
MGLGGVALKEYTANDYLERLNRVQVFIGENLDRSLSLARLAEVACFSPFHFHRIFAAHLGETLHDHVRRLRLERAAMRLNRTAESVTEIAMATGFDTPAAFSKAFRCHFGQTPSEFRDAGAPTANSPGSLILPEAIPLKPEIKQIAEKEVLFVRRSGPYADAAAAAWGALMGFAYQRKIITAETELIGISHDDPEITPEALIRYDACITFSGNLRPEGDVGTLTIPGGRYAVFLHRGPYQEMGHTLRGIFAGWLPASGARLRECPTFERYLNRDPRRTKPANLRTEIWLPLA